MDGNFHLRRKRKPRFNDPDDVALIEYGGYFPPTEEYNEYCKSVGAAREEVCSTTSHPANSVDNLSIVQKSTCTYLRAVNAQEKNKFKGCDIQGVVACKDGRHDMFLHHGMVDLYFGERYVHHLSLNLPY